jgi:hypothetical protein
MFVKFPVCLVKEVNVSPESGAQYITLLEPGGGEYNLTARPNDPEHPCDAAVRLLPWVDRFQPCEIEAEIAGRISTWEGQRKQLLTLHQISVKPVPVKGDSPAAPK